MGAVNCSCWGQLKDACWWVRWACVSGEGGIGRAIEVSFLLMCAPLILR